MYFGRPCSTIQTLDLSYRRDFSILDKFERQYVEDLQILPQNVPNFPYDDDYSDNDGNLATDELRKFITEAV